MEKRLLLAVLLMSAVIMVTNILFPPPPQPQAGARADSAVVRPAARPARVAPLATAPPARADTVVVASELFRYAFPRAAPR